MIGAVGGPQNTTIRQLNRLGMTPLVEGTGAIEPNRLAPGFAIIGRADDALSGI
jgi:hypothetical protein